MTRTLFDALCEVPDQRGRKGRQIPLPAILTLAIAATLAVVAIFLPVAFMSGIVGRFMSSFGFTAAFAIMVSLLVSFTLTPMLCTRMLRRRHSTLYERTEPGFQAFYGGYGNLLRKFLRNRATAIILLLLIVAVLTIRPAGLFGKVIVTRV